jgi:hypothetical protein
MEMGPHVGLLHAFDTVYFRIRYIDFCGKKEIAECRGLSKIPTEFEIYVSTGHHLEARDNLSAYELADTQYQLSTYIYNIGDPISASL